MRRLVTRLGSIECGLEQGPGIVGRMTESVCPSCGWYSTAGTNGVEPSFPASPACYGAYLELAASTRNERAGTSFISRPSTLMPLSTPVRRQSRSACGLRSWGSTLTSTEAEPAGSCSRHTCTLGDTSKSGRPCGHLSI